MKVNSITGSLQNPRIKFYISTLYKSFYEYKISPTEIQKYTRDHKAVTKTMSMDTALYKIMYKWNKM